MSGRRRRGGTSLVLVLLTAGCALGAPAETPGPASSAAPPATEAGTVPADAGEYAQEVAAETNALREVNGVPLLATDGCATDAALDRAGDLVGAAELEHAALDAVIAACDPPGGTAAENLSRADAPPAEVVDAWSRSPGHRANLLDPALSTLGVGCVLDDTVAEQPQMLCAQVFLG